jgi:hypothetical protein
MPRRHSAALVARGNLILAASFLLAMFDCTDINSPLDPEIARYDVSEDGVTWRPYDPARDTSELLHTRIVFAEPHSD